MMKFITLFLLVVLASAVVSVNAADNKQLRTGSNNKYMDLTNDVDSSTMDRIKARYLNTVKASSTDVVQDSHQEERRADELSSMSVRLIELSMSMSMSMP
jgi:hypothetical protein